MGRAPELDPVAEPDRSAVDRVLVGSADVAQIAVANHQMMGAAPAKPVRRPIHHRQAVVNHVVGAPLVDHVPRHGQLDALVERRRIGLRAEEHAPRRAVVIIVVRILERFDRPLLPSADLAMIEDDVAHVHGEGIGDVGGHRVQVLRPQLEHRAGRQDTAEAQVQAARPRRAADAKNCPKRLPLRADRSGRRRGRAMRPGRTAFEDRDPGHGKGLAAPGEESHLQRGPFLDRHRGAPKLHVVRRLAAPVAGDLDDPAPFGVFFRQGNPRAGLLVVAPSAVAEIRQPLAAAILHWQSCPQTVFNLDPVFRPAPRPRAEQERLGPFAIRRVRHRRRPFAACRHERTPPLAAALEADRVARLQLGGVDPLQAPPRRLFGPAIPGVVAAGRVDIEGPARRGKIFVVGERQGENNQRSEHRGTFGCQPSVFSFQFSVFSFQFFAISLEPPFIATCHLCPSRGFQSRRGNASHTRGCAPRRSREAYPWLRWQTPSAYTKIPRIAPTLLHNTTRTSRGTPWVNTPA